MGDAVTREQALAFVDALTGWQDIADQQGTPKSPHAMTHLAAVIGAGKVPSMHAIQRAHWRTISHHKGRDVPVDDEEHYQNSVALVAYLRAVAAALEQHIEVGGVGENAIAIGIRESPADLLDAALGGEGK